MGVLKEKVNNEIEYKQKTNYNSTTATIKTYDNMSNTATIEYKNPNGAGILLRKNVPINIPSGGLVTTGWTPGTKCLIIFQNGYIHSPVITGICDPSYSARIFPQKTNANQGAYVLDSSLYDEDTSIKTTPMIEDWICENGVYSTKEKYSDFDIDKEVQSLIYMADKYDTKDEGITNLNTKATIKTCANGDIKIFIDDNTGICLNHNTRSIELYGNIKINGKTFNGGT